MRQNMKHTAFIPAVSQILYEPAQQHSQSNFFIRWWYILVDLHFVVFFKSTSRKNIYTEYKGLSKTNPWINTCEWGGSSDNKINRALVCPAVLLFWPWTTHISLLFYVHSIHPSIQPSIHHVQIDRICVHFNKINKKQQTLYVCWKITQAKYWNSRGCHIFYFFFFFVN